MGLAADTVMCHAKNDLAGVTTTQAGHAARFALTLSAGFGVTVALRGAPREDVTLAWVGPGAGLLGTVYVRTLQLGDDGTLTTLLETN